MMLDPYSRGSSVFRKMSNELLPHTVSCNSADSGHASISDLTTYVTVPDVQPPAPRTVVMRPPVPLVSHRGVNGGLYSHMQHIKKNKAVVDIPERPLNSHYMTSIAELSGLSDDSEQFSRV
uniref:Neogenin_C domain-containing protein n=1 Tax=Steinernema glaseri TaxID=37863 RepID=A0A1I7ZBV6_9BILA